MTTLKSQFTCLSRLHNSSCFGIVSQHKFPFQQTISTFTGRINGTPFANCLGSNVLMPPQYMYAFGTDGRLLKILRIKRIDVMISRYCLGYNRSKYHIEGKSLVQFILGPLCMVTEKHWRKWSNA